MSRATAKEMRQFLSFVIVSLALLCQAQSLPDEVRLLARIRDHVGAQITQLEDYICLQTSRRYRTQGKDAARKHRLESSEVLTLEVAHVGENELFAWPGAGRFEDRKASEIVAGGMTDTGSFSLFARSLFQPRTPAAIRYHGVEECQGRSAARYDFSVSTLFSGYTIKTPAGSAQAGYSGSFWAYPDTLDLCRLTVRAEDVPSFLNLAAVETVIDYGEVRIGSSGLRLPQTARTTMTSVSGDISENLTDFTHCRRYSADSRILFDGPHPETGVPSEQVETVTLPQGLTVAIKLLTPLDSETACVGDAITARVEAAVTARRRTWLPAGALLSGRIRRLEQFASPSESVLLGLEFTDFSFAGSRGLFFADFQQSDAGTRLQSPSVHTNWTTLLHGGILESTSIEEFTNQELPGVATFHFPGKTGRLPAGTRMRLEDQRLRGASLTLCHSQRSATEGSTRDARSAGMTDAAHPTANSATAAAASDTGSRGFTPYSIDSTSRASASAPATPATIPANTGMQRLAQHHARNVRASRRRAPSGCRSRACAAPPCRP